MEDAPPSSINPRRWSVLTVVVAAQFMYVVDIFIVNVAISAIRTDLQASTAQIESVIALYLRIRSVATERRSKSTGSRAWPYARFWAAVQTSSNSISSASIACVGLTSLRRRMGPPQTAKRLGKDRLASGPPPARSRQGQPSLKHLRRTAPLSPIPVDRVERFVPRRRDSDSAIGPFRLVARRRVSPGEGRSGS